MTKAHCETCEDFVREDCVTYSGGPKDGQCPDHVIPGKDCLNCDKFEDMFGRGRECRSCSYLRKGVCERDG
jgi:hypothetical protein